MKEIFKRIEGREWDIMGNKATKREIVEREIIECRVYSLADLLANKSWCQAVWGDRGWTCEGKGNSCEHWPDKDHRRYAWDGGSIKAFQILQQQGQEACINYITKTMR